MDVANYIEQQKKISKFGKYVRDHAIAKAAILQKEPESPPEDEDLEVELPTIEEDASVPDLPNTEPEDMVRTALNDF